MKHFYLLGISAISLAAGPVALAQTSDGQVLFQDELTASDAATSDFSGRSVAVRNGLAVVGAPEADPAGSSSGAAYVYVRDGSNWIEEQKLQPDDPAASLRFGSTVAINEVGDTILVAGRGNARGVVYLFVRDESQWVQQGRLAENEDFYGSTADISGDTVVVGAWGENSSKTASGAAYVYFRSGTSWSLQKKIKANDPGIDDNFGWSVAISGDTIAVGAPFDDIGGGDAGSVYVFVRSGTNWTQQQRLNASDPAGRDWFGLTVDVSGDWVVVGSPNDDDGATDTGSAYLFERGGTTWTFRGKLGASDGAAGDSLGKAIAINESANVLLLGVSAKDSKQGAAYLYSREPGTSTWGGERVLRASEPVENDSFGASVAIGGVSILVGATGDDSGVTDGGSAAVFTHLYLDADALASWARKLLYYSDAAADSGFDRNKAAFRYKKLLYGEEDNRVRPRFETMSSLYGPAERARAEQAEDQVLAGLAIDPSNAVLGSLLLDIYYERTAAETILADDLLEQADKARFGPPISSPPPDGGFLIDQEISLRREYLSRSRDTMRGYFDLLKMPLDTLTPGSETTRWASRVIGFSTEYTSGSWSAAQALGQPDTYPDSGDIATAWASTTADGQPEYLELGFDDPAPIDAVSVYETYNPGAVNKVSVRNPDTGEWDEAWSGVAAATGDASRIFTVSFPPTSYPVDAVRIDIDSPSVASWNEIDAVSVSRTVPPTTMTDGDFGRRLFQTLVPGRSLEAATYIDGTGAEVPVDPDSRMLFDGYKDLVLLFEGLRDRGRQAVALARLLMSRNGEGDRQEATALVSGSERSLLIEGLLLKGMFETLPPDDDPSGLAQAIDGWSGSLNALATLQQSLHGGDNALGFADDFMMYVQKFTGAAEYFDSYDALRERLDPNTGSNPLRAAKEALQQVVDSYASYRGFQDQLASEFDNSSITYRDRLRDIVGVFPDDPNYSDDPTANPGSELDLQYRSVELAKLQIQHNQQEVDNLNAQIQIEINKATSISNVVVDFGNRQAELTKLIGHYNAAQAGANAMAEALSVEKLTTGLFFGFLVNAGIQAGAEELKAGAEADKEELAALEQATIAGIESDATVKTLTLGLKTLAVDSQTAAVTMEQELNRLIALFREKSQLEQEIAEHDSSVAARYFADPVHRLTAQADMVAANLAFDEAQKWLYFMTRALEYKWNTPFRNYSYGGRVWSADSVFKLRNADELVAFYEAMDSYESQIQLPKDDYFDWFSVRDDFMGYKLKDSQGQDLLYPDPATGATVDGLTAFRNRLRELQDEQGNIVLNFSTVTEIPGGTFFRGPRFNAQGQVTSKGLFLDKIRWLKINLPGHHPPGRVQLTGELKYGGTGFIRNFDVGTFDPERPDRLRNEFTSYSTRYWYYHAPSASWRFNEALSASVTMQLSSDPRVPPSVQELDVFKERSVATTGWELTIPTEDGGQSVMNIDNLDDVELYFYHYAVVRP